MNSAIIIVSTCLFSVSVAYLTLSYNFTKIRKQYEKLFVDMLILEKYVNELEASQIKGDDNVHKENFVKFLSDSRDWAYQYIEDVQEGLSKFVGSVEPEINYFKEYGDIGSMAPNYYSMKKFVEEYEKLKMLLPTEEKQWKMLYYQH